MASILFGGQAGLLGLLYESSRLQCHFCHTDLKFVLVTIYVYTYWIGERDEKLGKNKAFQQIAVVVHGL